MPCLDCGTPTRGRTRCPVHTQTHRMQRASTTQRGYGSQHQARAALLRAQQLPCTLCGRDIDYALHAPHPMSYTAHHPTRDKAGPLLPAHRVCNEQAGQPVT
jgi:hypothetical protein